MKNEVTPKQSSDKLNELMGKVINSREDSVSPNIYVVCKFILGTDLGAVWEIQGVFDSREKAEENCVDERFGVGPLTLNEPLPFDTIEWDGFYYPLQQSEGNS